MIDKWEFIETLDADGEFRRSVLAVLTQDIDDADRLSEASLQGTLQDLTTTLQTLNSTVGRLAGAEFEWETAKRLPLRLAENLRVKEVRIIRGRGLQTGDGQRLLDTVSRSRLPPPQRRRIDDTDIIASGESVDSGRRDYIAVEASTMVRMSDITRSRDTAAHMEEVFGVATHAVVVGYAIRDEDRQGADEENVTVILLESD